jgi:L-aspartate semialdehyde sulfurtransferase ferredoxin
MKTKRYVLTFPPEEVERPYIYQLVTEYDIMPNILRARIDPQDVGHMVVELKGKASALKRGLKYLHDQGVRVEPLGQEIRMNLDKCIQCGACTGFCPTGALFCERPSMRVVFDEEKCVACELCLTACLTHAMEGHFED